MSKEILMVNDRSLIKNSLSQLYFQLCNFLFRPMLRRFRWVTELYAWLDKRQYTRQRFDGRTLQTALIGKRTQKRSGSLKSIIQVNPDDHFDPVQIKRSLKFPSCIIFSSTKRLSFNNEWISKSIPAPFAGEHSSGISSGTSDDLRQDNDGSWSAHFGVEGFNVWGCPAKVDCRRRRRRACARDLYFTIPLDRCFATGWNERALSLRRTVSDWSMNSQWYFRNAKTGSHQNFSCHRVWFIYLLRLTQPIDGDYWIHVRLQSIFILPSVKNSTRQYTIAAFTTSLKRQPLTTLAL